MDLTPTQSIQLVDEYGVLIVIAGIFLSIMLVLFGMTVARLRKQDNEISPAMTKVAESQHAVAEALTKSAEEKRHLKDVIDNNTKAVDRVVLIYQKAMEKVEKDDEFLAALTEELKSHGVQQGEILNIVRELRSRV